MRDRAHARQFSTLARRASKGSLRRTHHSYMTRLSNPRADNILCWATFAHKGVLLSRH